MGERCIYRPNSSYFNKLDLITGISKKKRKLLLDRCIALYPVDECIPLLHWEKLEEILEEMGYAFYMHEHKDGYHAGFYGIGKIKGDAEEFGKTRQEAVQRAVLALAEEKEK